MMAQGKRRTGRAPSSDRPSRHEEKERGRGERTAAGREHDEASIIYGFHPVLEALRQGNVSIERIFLCRVERQQGRSRTGQIHRLARDRSVPVQFSPAVALDRLADGGKHQGVIAMIASREYSRTEDVLDRAAERGLLVLADGVQDPRNLGAILRTAGAAGAAGVIIPTHGSCGLTPAVAKAAAGAVESVPVAREGNIASLIPDLKERGFWIVGLDPKGEKLWTDADFRRPTVLVLGGEQGLRELVRKRCDLLVRLPMDPSIDSLNVSVAAGAVLYELLRQRRINMPG